MNDHNSLFGSEQIKRDKHLLNAYALIVAIRVNYDDLIATQKDLEYKIENSPSTRTKEAKRDLDDEKYMASAALEFQKLGIEKPDSMVDYFTKKLEGHKKHYDIGNLMNYINIINETTTQLSDEERKSVKSIETKIYQVRERNKQEKSTQTNFLFNSITSL